MARVKSAAAHANSGPSWLTVRHGIIRLVEIA